MRSFGLVMLAAASMLLSACATPTVAASDDMRVESVADLASDYQLGVGDKVRIIVFNEESLSGEFQVNAAGKISMPLIGDVDAINNSPAQLGTALQQKFGSGYLRDPRISVEVLAYRPYFILGEIKTPAQYPFSNGLTVMNAIATAGGFTPRAQMKVAYIRRAGEDQEKAYKLSPDLRVRPGDTIRVSERLF